MTEEKEILNDIINTIKDLLASHTKAQNARLNIFQMFYATNQSNAAIKELRKIILHHGKTNKEFVQSILFIYDRLLSKLDKEELKKLQELQIPTMKEIWDNPIDDCWNDHH